MEFSWATVNPYNLPEGGVYQVQNLVEGQWVQSERNIVFPDPLNGGDMVSVPDTLPSELDSYRSSMRSVPKSGLHNPLKRPERYLLYGQICQKVAEQLQQKSVFEFFVKLIQRVAPKSYGQAAGELNILKKFFENFSGDQVRFLARGFSVPGDHLGQQSSGYRWPYGAVAVITPFNFPLEIPIMQVLGALFMGNKVLLKPEPKVALAAEQFLRFLHFCGMPLEDVNLLNGRAEAIETLITENLFRNIQFTGSSRIAERVCELNKGRVKLEDSGYDWKILGPDVSDFEYVAYTCDQDAYAFSGQKCSAQSILFAHPNWVSQGLYDKLAQLAQRRKLEDLTICPVLTWNNQQIQNHIDKVLEIPGSRVLFGGHPLTDHQIPPVYGAFHPTAVFVPIDKIPENFELVTSELFGPFQIVTEWTEIQDVIDILERLDNYLTAAVVSKDQQFIQHVLANTVNGTTYSGIRARTTGAPQNHWFGPAGDPRCAGIGSPEAIKLVWSCHREIIQDVGPVSSDWQLPAPT